MSPDTRRLFVAIELPEHTRRVLAGAINSLRRDLQEPLRWVAPDSLHLTLKFLGNVESGRIGLLATTLEEVAKSFGPFRLCLDGAGTFPGRGAPRVLWAGLGGDLERLMDLQAAVERVLVTAGEAPQDNPFRPHLTLARVRGPLPSPSAASLRDRLQDVRFMEEDGFEVRGLSLVHSTLTPQGAVYQTLAVAHLSA